MKARVIADIPSDIQANTLVEVIGFVYYAGTLRAVYRDDEGYVADVPVAYIRMLPHVVEVAA